ncbi:MAG: hypothetical protein AAFX06_09970 [Planctomycetota bacterium]
MAKKSRQSSPSSLLMTLVGPAIILFGYASYVRLYPSDDAKAIVQLERDLQSVKDREVSVQQKVAVSEQIEKENARLNEINAKLDESRRTAGEMMRGEFDLTSELVLEGQINQVLSSSGLRFVDETPVAARSQRNPGLLRSLSVATKSLGEVLTEFSSEEADSMPITLPPDLPLEVNPVEWLAQQRSLRVGRFEGPETRSTELKVVGGFHSMVAGLEAIIDTCPSVVVTSIGFEPPSDPKPGMPLIWNVRLRMQPAPQSVADMSRGGEDFAGEMMGTQTFTAAKPPIAEAGE